MSKKNVAFVTSYLIFASLFYEDGGDTGINFVDVDIVLILSLLLVLLLLLTK